MPGSRSVNTWVAHCACRQRHRLTWSRSVTARPCSARSFNVRQYRLWRAWDRRPHVGQHAEDCPSASTSTLDAVLEVLSHRKAVVLGSNSFVCHARPMARGYP